MQNPSVEDWYFDALEPAKPAPARRVSARYGRPDKGEFRGYRVGPPRDDITVHPWQTETPCLATLVGRARGLAARMRDLDDEIDQWYAARSPCGIHMYPTERDACERCAEHRHDL